MKKTKENEKIKAKKKRQNLQKGKNALTRGKKWLAHVFGLQLATKCLKTSTKIHA